MRCANFAVLLMHNAYRRRRPLERVGRLEAMMEQRGRQLDLLAFTRRAIQHQRLDPMLRLEVTVLLKLLLNECSAARAKVQEANDEQDNA
jgi:hypothetical protein